ncbi:MAG TPA: hypothetical protein DCZ94_10545 [Lentisphaeria bacterium]|nr:MAG: hypothetical protein A2X48_06420 [Lentisphaerae bacterium GWF2_49_21]HBC87383.1 hypothetical protein [Lentisphaeria bacterium]
MFLSSFTGLYAESFEDVKDSIVIIDTETGRRCAILVKMDGILYILTSQDALTGGIVSIKTLSGKILQAQSCEVPEEQIGLLRMKTDFPEAKDVTINGSSKNSGVEVFKTDLKMGIIIEQQTGIEKNNALKFPDENGAPVTFIEEAVGSPVVNKKDNKVLGVVGARGFAVQNCGFAWTEMNKDLVGRKNELQILKQDMKWSKADLTQLIKQGSLIDEAEAFLYPFTVLADFWCNNPYASIVIKPEQPERMKPWIETQNLMVKEIPTIRFKIQEGSKLMGDTMKNVSSGQLKDKSKIIGKRLTDFAPVYQKTLASPNIKWESSYFKKKAEDLSTVFKNLAEGLRKEAEDNTKVNPPL